MLLVSKSIVLNLGLCEPPDQKAAKFCYFRSLSVDSKCLDIPTLPGTKSQFLKLQIRNQKSQNIPNAEKTRHRKDPQCSWTSFEGPGFFGCFGILMFWTVCLVCMQHPASPEPSVVQFSGSHHSFYRENHETGRRIGKREWHISICSVYTNIYFSVIYTHRACYFLESN